MQRREPAPQARGSYREPETRTDTRSRGRADTGRGADSARGSEGRRAFSYQARTAEDLSKRASMGARDFDSFLADHVKVWKANNGANALRIMPPTWQGAKHYGLDVWVHYGVGPDDQSYLCLDKMKGEECPICRERDRARRAGEDETYIKDLEPTRRVLMYLVDRDHESDGVQAWAAPWTIDRDISAVSVDRRTQEVLPIDDPENGYDVEFERTGKGMNTKYVGLAVARRSSSLGNMDWLDFAVDNPLPEILVYHSAERIAQVFGGGGSRSTREAEQGAGHRDAPAERTSRGQPPAHADEEPPRRRQQQSAPQEPELPTFEQVHAMTGAELDDAVSLYKLTKINPQDAESDAQLAEWICEDLNLQPAPPPSRSSSRRGAPVEQTRDESAAVTERLRAMRERDIPY